MISRRTLFRLTSMATAALGGSALAKAAQAQPAAVTDLAGLADLPAADDAAPIHIPGQGWFEPADPSGGEPDGITRIAAADGRHWRRSGYAGRLDPAWFRQPQDGTNDAPALQRAFDHPKPADAVVVALGSRHYRCLSRLTIDPTRCAVEGHGAVLDFSEMPQPPDLPPALTLADLPTGQGWQHQDGSFSRDEGPGEALTHQLSLPEPGRYRFELLITELSGRIDYPALYLIVTDADGTELGGTVAVSPGHFDFEIESPQGPATLSIQTDCALRLTRFDVTPQHRREAVLIQAGEDSAQYGHLWLSGVTLRGPGADATLHGMRFETLAEARSSRLAMRDVTVEGFHTGLILSHRAYLIHATGLHCACETGLHFLGGAWDAGEMISLYASTIEAARIALRNNGGEFALFGTSIDFVDQVLVGTGQLGLQACHLETSRPKAADKPLFDLGHGTITIDSGSFQIGGNEFEMGNQCDHIFLLRSRLATARMQDVAIYNLLSQSGALAGGPGRLDIARIRGNRPRHMAPIVQFAPERNLLGPLPLDLRSSDSPTGAMRRFSLAQTRVTVPPEHRHLWVVGTAVPGAELGLSFRIRSDATGAVWVTAQALDGETRLGIGDGWPVEVGPDWTAVMRNTGGPHPLAPLDGRMPQGFAEIALVLDLTGVTGPVEIDEVFLCAS